MKYSRKNPPPNLFSPVRIAPTKDNEQEYQKFIRDRNLYLVLLSKSLKKSNNGATELGSGTATPSRKLFN